MLTQVATLMILLGREQRGCRPSPGSSDEFPSFAPTHRRLAHSPARPATPAHPRPTRRHARPTPAHLRPTRGHPVPTRGALSTHSPTPPASSRTAPAGLPVPPAHPRAPSAHSRAPPAHSPARPAHSRAPPAHSRHLRPPRRSVRTSHRVARESGKRPGRLRAMPFTWRSGDAKTAHALAFADARLPLPPSPALPPQQPQRGQGDRRANGVAAFVCFRVGAAGPPLPERHETRPINASLQSAHTLPPLRGKGRGWGEAWVR